MQDHNTYTIAQFADLVGVTTKTIKRWIDAGKIGEPQRHPRTAYRLFTEENVKAALLYKNRGIRAGELAQISLITEKQP